MIDGSGIECLNMAPANFFICITHYFAVREVAASIRRIRISLTRQIKGPYMRCSKCDGGGGVGVRVGAITVLKN
jgi:hypothetical protein